MNGGPAPWAVHDSPLGPLTLVGGPGGLQAIHYEGGAPDLPPEAQRPRELSEVMAQLDQYFAGERRAFALRLDLRGAPLHLRVWHELQRIPHGRTVSYRELAETVGRPDAVRAVAGAVARTPVPIVVPCHRVIGSAGSLRGYIGGLGRKAALLDLERAEEERSGAPGGAAQ